MRPPQLAFKNRNTLKDQSGCYYCLKTFETKQIKEWTDQGETALCPFCSVDSVVPETNPEILKQWYAEWFEKTRPPTNFAQLSAK
jgi:hypothetical protein